MTMLLCACFSVTSCYDDSLLRTDIENLEDRVTALEDWQKSVNNEISTIKSLITALEQKNFITEVEEFDGGYKVHLQTGEVLTINHGTNGIDGEDGKDGVDGKDGHSPEIGVAKDGDVYYWTLDGEFILDSDGNKLPVTGPKGDKGDNGEDGADGADGEDAVAPQVRINKDTNYWEISIDGGKTWESTDVKATGPKGDKGDKGDKGETGEAGADGEDGKNGSSGDSFFRDVDYTTSPNYVIFKLRNGTEIVVPRVCAVEIDLGNPNLVLSASTTSTTIKFKNLTADNFNSLVLEVLTDTEDDRAIVTKALNVTASYTDIVFNATNGEATAPISISGVPANTSVLILRVTLITSDGNEISKTQAVKFAANLLAAINATSEDSKDSTPEEFNLSQPVSTGADNNIHVDEGETLTLNLESATITNTANSNGAIKVDGEMTITGTGTLSASANHPVIVVGENGSLTIEEGVTVSTTSPTEPLIEAAAGCTLVINGGVYTAVADPSATASLSSVATKADVGADDNYCAVYAPAGAKVYINGGIFQNTSKTSAPNLLANAEGGSITVTGGTFYGFDPSTKGYVSSNKVTRYPAENKYVVGAAQKINTEAALRAAVDAGSANITLEGNITLTSPLIFKSTTTLDLKNYSITPAAASLTAAAGTYVDSVDGLIYVTKGANLTIKGTGSLDVSGTSVAGAIVITEKNIDGAKSDDSKAKLTINGPTLRGNGYAISGNGNRNGTVVNINSGKLIAEAGTAIYQPQAGDLVITGGDLIGLNAAVEVRSGNLVISGGSFVSTSDTFKAAANANGTTVVGAAVAVSQHATNQPVDVKISGGTYKGFYAFYEKDLHGQPTTVTLSISGGTFSGAIWSANYLQKDWFITGGVFNHPNAIFFVAKNGEVIVNIENNLTFQNPILLYEGKVTLNLNNNVLTLPGQRYIRVYKGAELIVNNGTIDVPDLTGYQAVNSEGSVELNKVTLNSNYHGVFAWPLQGSCTIIDSNIVAEDGYGICTNASETGQMHKIVVTNSTITGMDPILINTTCDATFNNCNINGHFHGVIMRGGTAVFDGCTITYTRNTDQYLTHFENSNWGQGNNVNLGGLIMGNKTPGGSSYQYPTNVILKNTDIVMTGTHGNLFPSVYAWANEAPDNGVWFTYDDASDIGDKVIYGNEGKNITVNDEPVYTAPDPTPEEDAGMTE